MFAFYGTGNPCAPVSPSALLRSVYKNLRRMRPCHGSSKLRSRNAHQAAAAKVLGAAGLGLSLASSASASTMPAAGIPQSDNTSPNQRFFLGEEEMADVSLATFHLFDRENFGSGVQLARGGCGGCGCGHGGGGGCGGCRGGGGCGGFHGGGGGGFVGCRGCAAGRVALAVRGCGGGGFVAVRGCAAFRGCRGFRGCGCGGCGFFIGAMTTSGSVAGGSVVAAHPGERAACAKSRQGLC